MRPTLRIVSLALSGLFVCMLCCGSSIPSSVFGRLTDVLNKDFVSIDRIQTYSMSDDTEGRFDIIAIGTGRTRGQGWRADVFSVDHGLLTKRWDSQIVAQRTEFENSGPSAIRIESEDKDYELVIEGCARHECSDGISGFFVFFGKSGQGFSAKVVTEGLDKPVGGPPKYDVTFSPGIPQNAKKVLQSAICHSDALTNKSGLPFACENE